MDREKWRKLFDFSGRVVIVTGGTRGIGRSIAEGFVAAGAKVVVASRKPDACEETARHLIAQGGEALGVPTHMGDLDSIAALTRATVDRFGRIDVVVNNAATALTQPLGQFTPDAWNKVFSVDLLGPVFLVQEALPWLEKSPNASVVNVISAGGASGRDGGPRALSRLGCGELRDRPGADRRRRAHTALTRGRGRSLNASRPRRSR